MLIRVLFERLINKKIRALVSSHRDRGRQKRDFHCLWITQINAITHEKSVLYSYSRLIHNLYKKKLLLNHKILAQIAISNNRLYILSNKIIKSNSNKVDYKVM